MSDDIENRRKVYTGEVLPPETAGRPNLPDMPTGSPFGISLFARAKFDAQARAFRAHADFRRAQRESMEAETALYGAVGERLAAQENLAKALTRQRHLGTILNADEAALLAELDGVFEEIAAAQVGARERAEDHALKRRTEKADLEAQALEAEARVERLKNPPREPPAARDPDQGLSRAQKIARAIKRVKADAEELRSALIEAAGGEEHLGDDDRDQLAMIELWAKDQIRLIMESV